MYNPAISSNGPYEKPSKVFCRNEDENLQRKFNWIVYYGKKVVYKVNVAQTSFMHLNTRPEPTTLQISG